MVKKRGMKVVILQRGGERTTTRTKRHEILNDATKFYAQELMSTRMRNMLSIRIEMRKTKLKKDTLGSVSNLLIGSEAQRDFKIIIQRDEPLECQLHTLAHEMEHIRQIAHNELQTRRWKSDRRVHTRWRGEDWKGVEDDLNEPWEVEARRVANELVEKWRVEMKHCRQEEEK